MGKADVNVNIWLSEKKRFANLFNGVIYDGMDYETQIRNNWKNFNDRRKQNKKAGSILLQENICRDFKKRID